MVLLRGDGLVTFLFADSDFRKQLGVLSLPLLALLGEAALTFTICSRQLLLFKRLGRPAIPTSIKSIFLINLLLTLLFFCATLAQVVIEGPTSFLRHRLTALHYVTIEEDMKEQDGAIRLDLLAMAMVYMVVMVYVGAVARTGFGMGHGATEKEPWSLKAVGRMLRVVDRSKEAGLCFIIAFSMWSFFCLKIQHVAMWERMSDNAEDRHFLTFLLGSVKVNRLWRWSAAFSTFILLVLLSLYTIAARFALYVSCKRLSLQQADTELSIPMI